MRKEKDKERR